MATSGLLVQRAGARRIGAWFGLMLRQKSSGGRSSLGHITKRGDDDLRTELKGMVILNLERAVGRTRRSRKSVR
jgi:transposase